MSLLGEAVRVRRAERGWGQEQLAEALGVRQQTVSRWEKGLAVPRPGRVLELARLLDLDPARLHRLAGYLPPDERPADGAWQQLRARLPELSSDELVLLVELVRAELRTREGGDATDADGARTAYGTTA